jgi:hypothetical protein
MSGSRDPDLAANPAKNTARNIEENVNGAAPNCSLA